uniref:peroxisomal membrane protein 11A n=1 Tax=Euleptes europaea TaxID=460621 RepID=UPI0025426358|nr:peroxisomal membrane protein 11A [Euleptes europaea]
MNVFPHSSATQYTCMLLSYVLENKRGREAVLMKLKHLESSMSSGRKLFRLGNMVHAIVAARQSNQLPELVPRFCLTVSHLNRALYFVCDMLLWVRSVGLFPQIDKKKWRRRATRCYYYSLVMNLTEDLYELCRRMEQTARAEGAREDSPPRGRRVRSFVSRLTGGLQPFLLLLCLTLRRHPPLLLDTLKNLCDLSSPLDRLGIYKTHPVVIALCGIVSSLVGILTVASPSLKLKPSQEIPR